MLYPIIKNTIEKHTKQLSEIYHRERKTRPDEAIVGILVRDHKLKDLFEILEEIAKLNEEVQFLFFSKYFYEESRREITVPTFLATSSEKFDLVYRLKKLQEKPASILTASKLQNMPEKKRPKLKL